MSSNWLKLAYHFRHILRSSFGLDAGKFEAVNIFQEAIEFILELIEIETQWRVFKLIFFLFFSLLG
jgi:hypothetical protein